MSNRNMSLGAVQIAQPNWVGDFLDRDMLLPGGARIDGSLFLAYPGPVTVSAGLVGTAAAAVPKAGITGNGTVSAPAARIGARTETITLVALTATTFSVTGSVSGALGTATAGTPFVSNSGGANFTITAGGTAFVAGDTFTIAVTANVAVNAAAIGDIVIPVGALTAAIPAATVLNFGIIGKTAVVSQTAAAAAESISVLPLDQVIATGSVTTFAGSPRKIVPSGTMVSRTFVQRAANALWHPAVSTDDEFGLTAHDVVDASINDEAALVRGNAGCTVKENFLPGFAAMSAPLKVALRAHFFTTTGAE